MIRDLLDWSANYPDYWRKTWQLIEEKWDRNDPCPDGASSMALAATQSSWSPIRLPCSRSCRESLDARHAIEL